MIDPKLNVLMKVWIRCLLLFLIDFCVAELGCLKFFKFSYTIAMLKLYEICLSFFSNLFCYAVQDVGPCY